MKKMHSYPKVMNRGILPEGAEEGKGSFEEVVPLPSHIGVSKTINYRNVEVPRSPCTAKKDCRVPPRAAQRLSKDWTNNLVTIPKDIGTIFFAIAKILCPHDWLEDDVYQSVILEMDRDVNFSDQLIFEYHALSPLFDNIFADLSADALILSLSNIENTPFFRLLLGRTILYLYDDPVVWSGCGYEGVAGCTNEMPRDDIDDVDWLPDPQAARGQS